MEIRRNDLMIQGIANEEREDQFVRNKRKNAKQIRNS
jgi:hypothetical protein